MTNKASVVFKCGAVSPLTSTITASPDTIDANGTSTSTITLQLKDAMGNMRTTSESGVTLTTTAGTLSPVTDNRNGSFTATLISSNVAGTATISGTVNSQVLSAKHLSCLRSSCF